MGSSFGWKSRAELIAHVDKLGEGYTLLATRTIGSNHWQLVRKADGVVFVALALLKCEQGDHGYKHMDETCGPNEVNCPLSWIEQAEITDPAGVGYAAEWRARVRAYHAAKKAAPEPKAGMIVTPGVTAFRLVSPLGPRKGWKVERVMDGKVFRMPAADVSRALLALAEVKPEPAKPEPASAAVTDKIRERWANRSSLGQLALSLD